MLTRLTRPLRTALRWVRQSSTWPLWCRVVGHDWRWEIESAESWHCFRCGRRRHG
jgi:hypothetical protein